MKTYSVFRHINGRIPMALREHITNFAEADDYATVMTERTGDTCYVVEYVSRERTIRSVQRQTTSHGTTHIAKAKRRYISGR